MYTSKDDVRGLVTGALEQAHLPDPASLVASLEKGLEETDLHLYTAELAHRADVFLQELGKALAGLEEDAPGAPPEEVKEDTVQSLLAALYPDAE